jgi:hypothetical protein
VSDTLDQLLASVLADPLDEAPRAALADFLQENPHLIADALRSLARHTAHGDLCGMASVQGAAVGRGLGTWPDADEYDYWDTGSWDDLVFPDGEYEDCPDCRGTALVNGSPCGNCNGRGWVA